MWPAPPKLFPLQSDHRCGFPLHVFGEGQLTETVVLDGQVFAFLEAALFSMNWT